MNINSKTCNGANAFEHSENHLLEFFSKAGSLYTKKESYYGNESSALELFKNAWRADAEKAMKLLFWLRDCRGGAGNRSGTREILTWLGNTHSEWVNANINLIPKYGRWDDLTALYNTPCENSALACWESGILGDNSVCGLASKWADRQDAKLRKYMKLSPKAFRQFVVQKTKVVETIMCNNEWTNINYSTVPSVASARYKNAFKRHDAQYEEWVKSLVKEGTVTKVNAETLMPHDIVRMVKTDINDATTGALADAQLKAMPNFMEGTNYRIMPICDFSGSMHVKVSGTIDAYEVSLALGLYCSEKVGSENPFYRKVIPFSTDSKIESWKNKTFAQAVRDIPNGYCGGTNIQKALNRILEGAILFNATNEQIPNVLLILSDMQFDQGGVEDRNTPVNACLAKWKAAGYDIPKVIYWNLAGNNNQPATCADKNVALVSGFSPSVLKAVLGGTDFSPMSILEKAIEKYVIVTP